MTIRKPKASGPEILEFARGVLAAIPIRELKPATERLYELTAKLYYYETNEVFCTTSKRTYYLRKAALTYFASHELKNAVKSEDVASATHALRVLAKFTSGVRANRSVAPIYQCPLASPTRRTSKRSSLNGLPQNWRQELVDGLSNKQVRQAALLIAATGVRPSEVQNGVDITPISGGVQVLVHGTKTDRGHGQPLRVFEIESELAQLLANEDVQHIQIPKANQISVEIGRVGRKLFSRVKGESVSAYSLRHAFASDLKASGVSGAAISAILGHSASDTKKHYGSHRQGRMRIKATLMHATRAVKEVTSTYGKHRPNSCSL